MSILMKLDSKAASSGTSDNFTINFKNPLSISSLLPNVNTDRYHFEVSLVNLTCWYTWYNISAEFGNNSFTYSSDGGATTNSVVIPDGIWSISAINSYLHSVMAENGHFETISGVTVYPIAIIGDENRNRVKVYIKPSSDYRLYLTGGADSFRSLLGFDSITISADGYTFATNNANITRGVNSLDVHCSLVNSQYAINNSASGDVIYSFAPNSTESVASAITREPFMPISMPINNNSISNINMYITDQSGRPISFNGEDVTYLLRIKIVKSMDVDE